MRGACICSSSALRVSPLSVSMASVPPILLPLPLLHPKSTRLFLILYGSFVNTDFVQRARVVFVGLLLWWRFAGPQLHLPEPPVCPSGVPGITLGEFTPLSNVCPTCPVSSDLGFLTIGGISLSPALLLVPSGSLLKAVCLNLVSVTFTARFVGHNLEFWQVGVSPYPNIVAGTIWVFVGNNVFEFGLVSHSLAIHLPVCWSQSPFLCSTLVNLSSGPLWQYFVTVIVKISICGNDNWSKLLSVVELAIPYSVCTHFLVPCLSSAIVSLFSLLVCMPDKSNYLKHILTTVRGSEIMAPPPCNLTRVLCWQSVTECVYWHWPSYFRGLRGRVPNLSNPSSQSSSVLKIHRKFTCLSGSCPLVHLSAVIVGGTCVIPLSYPLVLPDHSGIAFACTKVPKYRMSFWSEFPYIQIFPASFWACALCSAIATSIIAKGVIGGLFSSDYYEKFDFKLVGISVCL